VSIKNDNSNLFLSYLKIGVISISCYTVTLIKEDWKVLVTIGSSTLEINGVKITTGIAIELDYLSGDIMFPIIWAAASLGCNVSWNNIKQMVTLSS
jgi:hypothetical protein